MSAAVHNLGELRDALRADAARIVELLLGPPNKKLSTKKSLRWGRKGSLSLSISGTKRGTVFSHEEGRGGELLWFIGRERRCSKDDAIRWASDKTGVQITIPSVEDSDQARQRRAQQDADRRARQIEADARRQAEGDAERRSGIAWVQRIAKQTVPADGTLADWYLRQSRGIPRPAAEWPDAVRWHSGYNALVVVATREDGTVQRIQRVHLSTSGEKLNDEEIERRGLPAVKVTNGPQDGAVVRLPGDPAGPLLLAEGPETALACWSSTQHECWIALGGIGSIEPPIGRRVVAVADDNPPAHDAKHGDAARALSKAVAAWRKAGIDLVVATPWEVPRYDRSDFADLILSSGAEAVRDRITAALRVPRLRPYYDAPTEPRDAALARQRALIQDTIANGAISGAVRHKIARLREEAVTADPDFDQRPPGEKAAVTRRITRVVLAEHGLARLPKPACILITGSQGSGKTHTALHTVASLSTTLHTSAKLPADLVVRITQPSHEKAEEVLADYEKLATADSLPARLVRSCVGRWRAHVPAQ